MLRIRLFWPRHTFGQKWTHLHTYITQISRLTNHNNRIVKDDLYHLAIFIKAQ
jgi:hypothetical protein